MNDSPQIIIYYKHYQKLPLEEKKNINVTEHKKCINSIFFTYKQNKKNYGIYHIVYYRHHYITQKKKKNKNNNTKETLGILFVKK